VEERGADLDGDLPAHAGDELGHAKTEGAEHVAEEGVLLEAVAAAAGVDEFLCDGGGLQADGAAEENIEVFVGDGARVLPVDPRQGGERGVARAGVGDPGEVGVEIGRGRRHPAKFAEPG
jgi:hypothetical protein